MKRAWACLVCLGFGLGAVELPAQVAVTGMQVDGHALPVGAAPTPGASNRLANLEVPPDANVIHFAMEAGSIDSSRPWRLSYKLEGFDADWKRLYSPMRVVLRFLDEQNLIIAAHEALIENDSPGWAGAAANSPFVPALLEAVAPPRATKVQPWIVSGGPEVTTGLLAIRNVRVRVGTGPDAPVTKHSIETGKDLDQPLGSLEEWRRDGSRPQMAQVLRLESPQAHHVLALEDVDPRRFAAWLVPPHRCATVQPGQRVTLEWDQCHSVGNAGPGVVTYGRLAPGYYWFRVAAVGLDGTMIAPETSLAFQVLAPVWKRLWFWLLVGGTGSVTTAFAVRRFTRRRMQLALDLAERRHVLERERTRIARDIHDDLGTTLTQISMLSETARSNPRNPPETARELDRICGAVVEATRAMDEIVWAADPENDSLDELGTYISGFAQDLLNGVGVRCRLEMPVHFPRVVLSAEVRHNVFLVFKEALNNALKHGQPREVRVSMQMEAQRFVLIVEDDGCGFTPPGRPGHGMNNMQSRSQKLGGRLVLESHPGKGTKVRLEVPVDAS